MAAAKLKDWPPVRPDARLYWMAFTELGSDRPSGMGFGSIPFSSMKAYADEYGLRGAERDEFFHVIRAVDNRLCVLIAEKTKAAKAKK